MNEHIKFMREAIKEAELARSKDEVPIGAIVVYEGLIIARAHNLVETLTDATAHAEMQAITSAANYFGKKYLPECILYVTVEPCSMCAGACYWSQVGSIVFGAKDPKRGYSNIGEHLIHPKTKVIKGILSEECGQLMVDFFKQKR
ncbi:MAG: nucleoside deaminase [Prevotellaceae bacterium]|jgi:tRNA(adenine34) deaminase|nr:nucleoside deaminase [Prevotellaceae bacterium]